MSSLIKYHAARHALAVAKQVDEVKDIRDKAEAMRAYAMIAQDDAMIADATEIKLRAERRLGQMIAEQKAAGGLSTGTRGQLAGKSESGEVLAVDPPDRQKSAPTLAQAGISKDLSSRAQNIAAVPEDEFEREIAGFRDRTQSDGKQVQTRLVDRGREARGKKVSVEPNAPVDYDERDAAIDSLSGAAEALRRENERLTDELAAGGDPKTAETIAALRGEIGDLKKALQTANASLRAVTTSRDTLLQENAQLKVQIKMQRKDLDKLRQVAA